MRPIGQRWSTATPNNMHSARSPSAHSQSPVGGSTPHRQSGPLIIEEAWKTQVRTSGAHQHVGVRLADGGAVIPDQASLLRRAAGPRIEDHLPESLRRWRVPVLWLRHEHGARRQGGDKGQSVQGCASAGTSSSV